MAFRYPLVFLAQLLELLEEHDLVPFEDFPARVDADGELAPVPGFRRAFGLSFIDRSLTDCSHDMVGVG